ncbi:unnamed protein product [Pleuronectes platessa]|uniref:Uncharacterized protein n=1 Tax=Pleuronectes platessa TaxID=8262 RepID=A0A9N7YTB5_PLEPL|nr:unnamed protein product [Pleuronectes platessa]
MSQRIARCVYAAQTHTGWLCGEQRVWGTRWRKKYVSPIVVGSSAHWSGPALVTDLRKPVAATPPKEIMCLSVFVAEALPGSSRHFAAGAKQPKYLIWAAFRSASTSGASPGLEDDGEPPLSLVILARCLAGNQPSGPLRQEGGGDVSLLGMRPLYFSDIQQEQHSHHL